MPSSCVRSNVAISIVLATPAAAATKTRRRTKIHAISTKLDEVDHLRRERLPVEHLGAARGRGAPPAAPRAPSRLRGIARVDDDLVRLARHGEQRLRVVERHQDAQAVHEIDRCLDERRRP